MQIYFFIFLLHNIYVILSLASSSKSGEESNNYKEGKGNWCANARDICQGDPSSASSTSRASICDKKVLILLLSKQSKAFTLLSNAFKTDPSIVLLLNNHILDSCANVSASVSTFNSYTGDPFTHNPFNISTIFYNIQHICLKQLRSMGPLSRVPTSTTTSQHNTPSQHTPTKAHHARNTQDILVFHYPFPALMHLKHLLSLFPCARIIVSKRQLSTHKWRSWQQQQQEGGRVLYFPLAPHHLDPEELAVALRWLGLGLGEAQAESLVSAVGDRR